MWIDVFLNFVFVFNIVYNIGVWFEVVVGWSFSLLKLMNFDYYNYGEIWYVFFFLGIDFLEF